MIKVGDLVRVLPRKAEWENTHPLYTDEMLVFVGKEYRVKEINSRYWGLEYVLEGVCFRNQDFLWDSEWIEKVDKDVSLYD